MVITKYLCIIKLSLIGTEQLVYIGMKKQERVPHYTVIKKTSIGAPSIKVGCIDANKFIQNLSEGPIVFYSNCEGSEFEILDVILYNETWKKISLWSIAFHHGDRKIPSMKPTYFKLEARMAELGIVNVPGHFHKKATTELDEFIEKVSNL